MLEGMGNVRASGRLRRRRAKDLFPGKDCCFAPLSWEFVAVCAAGGMVAVRGAGAGRTEPWPSATPAAAAVAVPGCCL